MENSFELFSTRTLWKTLPHSHLIALAEQIQGLGFAMEFAMLCEEKGILLNNIIPMAGDNPGDTRFFLGQMSETLFSYSSAMCKSGRWVEAKRGLEFALMLKETDFCTLSNLSIVEFNLGNKQGAMEWASKALNYRPDPTSSDFWVQGEVKMMTKQGQIDAATALGEPDMRNIYEQLRQQMVEIIAICK